MAHFLILRQEDLPNRIWYEHYRRKGFSSSCGATFAMVVDRCGSMMRNGKFYVVDKNDNERPRYSDIVSLCLTNRIPCRTGRLSWSKWKCTWRHSDSALYLLLEQRRRIYQKVMVVIPPRIVSCGRGRWLFSRNSSKDSIIKRAFIKWDNGEIELYEEDYILIFMIP